jgi:CRP-like cAMP-binding protein
MNNLTESTFPSFYFKNDFTKYKSEFFASGKTLTLLPEDYLPLTAGNRDYYYYIVSGTAKLCMKDITGAEQIICFFGEDCCLPLNLKEFGHWTKSGIIYAKAFTPLTAVRISGKSMNSLLEKEDFSRRVFELSSGLMMLLIYKNINLSSGNSLNKICNFLWIYLNDINTRELSLTQAQIAQVAGTTRLEVARALRWLRDNDYVRTGRNKIAINNKERFSALCSSNIFPNV